MALQDQKITSSDLANKGVVGLPDTPNLSTLVMQQKFDEIATAVIVPKFNALIDYLIESLAPIVSDNPQDGEVLIYFANSSQYKNGVYRTTLSALKDVNVGGVQNKMFLCYDEDRDLWYPEASSGVMETISACKDVSIVNPQTGDIFKFDGTAWANVPDERGLLIVFNIDSEDGATITALTPSGDTVTATSLGSGQYIIKSDEYGEWVITGEKNGETVTTTVSVDTAKIYDVTMNFFAATITVTYPADATVTCSKGSEEYTATGSPYTFTVHGSGDWVIEGTRSGITETQTVTITTSGQSESVTLTILPDGSTITPTDSIPTLLHCADIWDKSYTSIGEVLADDDSLFKILTTDNSIDYLVRSTTYASSITADSDAMAMIGSYDYASDTLTADSTWLTAIASSSYRTSIYNVYAPKMTSNTTPSGECLASSYYSGDMYKPWHAFDDVIAQGDEWIANTGTNAWIGYKFTKQIKALSIWFKNRVHPTDVNTFPTSYKVEGSNDGTNWTAITDTITRPSAKLVSGGEDFTVITTPSLYQYYRAYIFDKSAGSYIALGNLNFYGRENGGVQTWLRSANITDKDYTTLAEVLADTTTLATLIASHDAVDYLVTAKAFIDGIVADATAMSYIGLNNYCANTLLADAEWNDAIQRSAYVLSVDNVRTPTMTSDNTPSGVASASSTYVSLAPYKAFDKNTSTGWGSNGTGAGQYIQYVFPKKFKCKAIKYTLQNYTRVSNLSLSASDGGGSWDTASITFPTSSASEVLIPWDNDTEYDRFRMNFSANDLAGGFLELDFLGREDV